MMPNDRTVVSSGFKINFRGGTVQKLIEEAISEELEDIGQKYKAAIIENISLTDHDLASLRALGYPYSTHTSAGPVHADDREVHTQSGRLLEGIELSEVMTDGHKFSIYVTSEAPYTQYLLSGTSRMRPRRFDEKSYEDIGGDSVFDSLKKRLKSLNYKITS
jgi:hypothetical protein